MPDAPTLALTNEIREAAESYKLCWSHVNTQIFNMRITPNARQIQKLPKLSIEPFWRCRLKQPPRGSGFSFIFPAFSNW